jgi:hypothetical protein
MTITLLLPASDARYPDRAAPGLLHCNMTRLDAPQHGG